MLFSHLVIQSFVSRKDSAAFRRKQTAGSRSPTSV